MLCQESISSINPLSSSSVITSYPFSSQKTCSSSAPQSLSSWAVFLFFLKASSQIMLQLASSDGPHPIRQWQPSARELLNPDYYLIEVPKSMNSVILQSPQSLTRDFDLMPTNKLPSLSTATSRTQLPVSNGRPTAHPLIVV